jgi:hypothetical protein
MWGTLKTQYEHTNMASKVAIHKRLIQLTLSYIQSPIEFLVEWQALLDETTMVNLVVIEEQ